ncbi:chemotaxis protein CheW [Candidatus Desantisbacteria bacterium]|nr:chemotaxis protein CheW [Candidatus Desantisbacteria bacterium]
MTDIKKIEILIFKIKNYLIGIDGEEVVEIVNIPQLFPLEEKYNFFDGIIDFHGKKIPVLSLAKKWGVSSNAREKQIIIAKRDNSLIGFLIDSSEAVVEVPLSALDNFPDFIKLRSYADNFWAIMKLKDKIILLLDTDVVINEKEKILIKEIS